MRKLSEVKAAERAACSKSWYIRSEEEVHQITHHGGVAPPEEILDRTLVEMKKLEALYGIEELMPDSEYDVGRADGRLEALRWMMGLDWDDESILDT